MPRLAQFRIAVFFAVILASVRKRISWAQLLKCTFKIDVLKCDKCGGLLAAAVPLLAAKGTAFTLIFFELALHRLEHFFLAFVY